MRCFVKKTNLTLVLSAALFLSPNSYCAPDTVLPDTISAESTEETPTPADLEKIQSLDISKPPETKHSMSLDTQKGEYFYPYRKSMSPRIGIVYNMKEYSNTQQFLYLLGVLVSFQDSEFRNYEVGYDIVTNSTAAIQLMRKWPLSRTRFRPYYKMGGGFRISPNEALSTFLKYENIQARAGAGFEHLLAPPMSVRMDAEAAITLKEIEIFIALGYSWAW